MRVHPKGLHVLGGIDQSVHVDGVLLSDHVPQMVGRKCGGWDWLNEFEVAGQIHVSTNPIPPHAEHWELWAVNIMTFGVRVLDATDGANLFVAGDDEWAAGLGTSYRDSYGNQWPNVYPLAVDNLYGWVALVTNYPNNPTLTYWTGTGLSVVGAHIENLVDLSFRDGVLTFRAAGNKLWQSHGPNLYPTPIQAPFAGARCTKGRYVLGYKDNIGDVVYDVTTGLGLPLHPPGLPPDAYVHDENGDLAQRDDGRILVATSKGAGEFPSEVQTYLLDLAAHTVNGEPRTPIDVMTVKPPPDPTPPPEEKPMPELYIKTRNGLFVTSMVNDGTRRLIALPTPDQFSVWIPRLVKGSKWDVGSMVFMDLVNFIGNPIGVDKFDAAGSQARCAIRTGTIFSVGRGDAHDWTLETEPDYRLTLRQDQKDHIYLEHGAAYPASLSSFTLVDVKTGKVYDEPFR